MNDTNETNQVQKQENPSKKAATMDMDNFFGEETGKIDELQLNDIETKDQNDLNLSLLFDLDLSVTVELARKNIPIKEILQLGEGAVIEFDKLADAYVDVYANNKKIAKGEVVVIDDRFGVRITNLVDPADRLKGIST